MHYNNFTIKYIEALQRNLNIELDENGECIFLPDKVDDKHINQLKHDLESIWDDSDSAISVIRNKQDSTLQCGLFGLVRDFDRALKTGYLLGDRVVLIDYLYDRVISKKKLH